ncbi:hypothetical protein ACS0TY_012638 [Phlomoides rotata]
MQNHVKHTSFVESLPKNQIISNERTRSQSPARSCRTIRTSLFPAVIEKESDLAALSGTDQLLFDNIRAFSRRECEENLSRISGDPAPIPSRFIGTLPPSPRVSNSEETSDSSAAEEDDTITILTYSKCPYADFQQSMKEMVEARVASCGVVDMEFLKELLCRYIDLNSAKFYGCIIRAFFDLFVISTEDIGRSPAHRRPWIGSGRRRLKLEIKRVRKFCQNQFVPR